MRKALAAVAHMEISPIPSIHKEILLSKEVLARYAGTYQFPHYTVEMVPERNPKPAHAISGKRVGCVIEQRRRYFRELLR